MSYLCKFDTNFLKNTNFYFWTGLCTHFVHRQIAGNACQAPSWTVSDQRTVFSGSLLTHQNSMKNMNSHKCLQMTSRVYHEMRQQGHGTAKRTSHFNKIIIIPLDSAEKSQNKITGRKNKSFQDKTSIYVIKMHQVTFHSGCVCVCVCVCIYIYVMNPAKPPTSNIWKLDKIDSQIQAKVQGEREEARSRLRWKKKSLPASSSGIPINLSLVKACFYGIS